LLLIGRDLKVKAISRTLLYSHPQLVIGRPVRELVDPNSWVPFRKALRSAFRDGTVTDLCKTIVLGDKKLPVANTICALHINGQCYAASCGHAAGRIVPHNILIVGADLKVLAVGRSLLYPRQHMVEKRPIRALMDRAHWPVAKAAIMAALRHGTISDLCVRATGHGRKSCIAWTVCALNVDGFRWAVIITHVLSHDLRACRAPRRQTVSSAASA
jgi:hypothetical protein